MAGSVLRGINLGGLEGGFGDNPSDPSNDWPRSSGPEAGHNYPLLDPQLIDYYHAKGVRIIRLTFSWDRMQFDLTEGRPLPDPVPGYAKYFENFKNVVDYATGLGIVVVVVPWQADASGHGVGGATWLGRLLGDASGEVDRYAFAAFWKKLATVFKDNLDVEYCLVNEPHDMSTRSWWTTAQKCVDHIRAAGATTTIHVPGNGCTAASRWTDPSVDADLDELSNAQAVLQVNEGATPLWDPLHNWVAEVHLYADSDSSGTHSDVQTPTVLRDELKEAMAEATSRGYRMFVGEVGLYAEAVNGPEAWRDFVDHVEEPGLTAFAGYAWWAGGWPVWWTNIDAPNFAVTPVVDPDHPNSIIRDTVNMDLIEGDFTP